MQSAAAKRCQLAVVDTSLCAITFSKANPREDCKHSHSLDHESGFCTQDPTAGAKRKEPAAKRHRVSEESKLVCFDYQSGQCWRGARCRFHHLCEWWKRTTPDIDAQLPGPTPERAGHPIPVKGKWGTTEHKYLKPCTSQRDSYHRNITQEKAVVVEQQPTLSFSNIYNQTTSSMTHLETIIF